MKNRAVRRAINPISPEDSESKICRTCLATANLVSIFGNQKRTDKKSEDLRLVTGLEIKPKDGLSQKICKKCLKIVHKALEFRTNSHKAEEALLKLVSSVKVKENLSEKTDVIAQSPQVTEEKTQEQVKDYLNDFFDYDCQMGYLSDVDQDKPVEKKPDTLKKPSAKRRKRGETNNTPYVCDYCTKEFHMRTSYRWHLRTHKSSFMCEACGKQCRSNHQLKEHKRAVHELRRIHKCSHCTYSSATKESLTIHERLHTGEKPYVCDYCAAAFHRRSNLVQHIAIHLPDKNFPCDLCNKRLKSRKFLQIHKHNVHTGKRYGYLCPVCERCFEKPNKVRAHCRRVHGLPDDKQPRITRVLV